MALLCIAWLCYAAQSTPALQLTCQQLGPRLYVLNRTRSVWMPQGVRGTWTEEGVTWTLTSGRPSMSGEVIPPPDSRGRKSPAPVATWEDSRLCSPAPARRVCSCGQVSSGATSVGDARGDCRAAGSRTRPGDVGPVDHRVLAAVLGGGGARREGRYLWREHGGR